MLTILASGIAFTGCQKINHPGLGKYPVDANPPGGPLKFFAAFEGIDADSVRANWGSDSAISYATGVSGKAVQFNGALNGYISYPNANDFGTATSFSVSLWINAGTVARKDHNNADGIVGFGKSSDFWGNFTLFADHEASTSDSMRLSLVLAGHWLTHDGPNRVPHMYDGNWHHIAVTYDANTSIYTMYIDGNKFDQRMVTGVAFADPSVLVLGGFQQAAGVQGTYADNSWMSGFPGMMDQFRMYSNVLSAADVAALYTNKK